jgi:hypothetical protein
LNNTRRIKIFIGVMMLGAAGASGYAGFASHKLHLFYALEVLALACATSRMKVKLPGINGNMSVNLPFLLTAVVNLSSAEAVAITCIATLAQCWPKKNSQFRPEQMAFNVSMMAFASGLASLTFHAGWVNGMQSGSSTAALALGAMTLFLGQTAPVAAIVALSEGKAAGQIWWSLAHLSFPYYVVSAGVSSMAQALTSHLEWTLALVVFPVLYGIHRCYVANFAPLAEIPRVAYKVRAAAAGA